MLKCSEESLMSLDQLEDNSELTHPSIGGLCTCPGNRAVYQLGNTSASSCEDLSYKCIDGDFSQCTVHDKFQIWRMDGDQAKTFLLAWRNNPGNPLFDEFVGIYPEESENYLTTVLVIQNNTESKFLIRNLFNNGGMDDLTTFPIIESEATTKIRI
jgi:hypothetical protein